MTEDYAETYRASQDRQRALADQLLAVKRDHNGALAQSLDTPGSAHPSPDWIADQPDDNETAELDEGAELSADELDEPAEPDEPARARMKQNPAQGRAIFDGPPTRPTGIKAKLDELLRTGRPIDLRDERTL